MVNKTPVFLAGPFIGELEWEMYRFAPYLIHLKKILPEYKLIVFTRPSRFDLYGKFANILVPLNLKNEKYSTQFNFGIKRFKLNKYNTLKEYYYKKYDKRFDIVEHIVPDISIWRNKIKWQFSRSKMDYNFQPRNENNKVVDFILDEKNNVFVTVNNSEIRHALIEKKYDVIMNHWLVDIVSHSKSNLKTSFIGCLILYLKTCKFIVGNMNYPLCKLALLLNIPVISINEKMSYDSISLLNPFNTPVINCSTIEEGVSIYENII